MNGLELAKRIRKINSEVHILLLTGYYIKDKLLVDEFRGAKIEEVLLKTVDMSDLGSRVIKRCKESCKGLI